jgi:methionine-rich copper-binding protein CopC
MEINSENHEEIRQYLLGSLSEEIQQRIEERLMTESSFLEELEVCEDELIDDYVNNELDADNRSRFESHFLCAPGRLQKLKFAMALGRYVSLSSDTVETELPDNQVLVKPADPTWTERLSASWNAQSWAFRSVLTVAVIAIIAVALWLSLPRTPSSFVALTLSISASDRAEGTTATRVTLPLAADALRITLKLPEMSSTSSGLRVELMNDKGVIKPLGIEGLDAQSVTVVIPADQLDRGEYALRLFVIKSDGAEQRVNGNYFFTVQ